MSEQPEEAPMTEQQEHAVRVIEIFMRRRAEKLTSLCMEAMVEGQGVVVIMEEDGRETVYASDDVAAGTFACYPRALHPEMWREQ